MQTTTETFRLAHAAGIDWERLTDQCLAALGGPLVGANIGFVYVTDSLDEALGRIVERLKSRTGIADWFGTVGFGICVTEREYFDTPAMSIMIGALPRDSFRLLPAVSKPGEKLSDDISAWIAAKTPTLGIVHADPRNAYLPAIIDSISDDTACFLVGGITASRGKCPQVAGGLSEGGVTGVLLGKEIRVVSGLTQGCSPIGAVHDVTSARDNVVIELDGRRALDVLKDDMGEVLARDLNRIGGYIHAALPISGSDTRDYLVRNLMGIDPQSGWIAIGERMTTGDKLMFVRRDGPSAMTDLKRMAHDVVQRANARAKAALYYSCVARGPNLFGRNSEELGAIAAAIGDVPLIGFFANGEISHNRLYGYTGVLTLVL